MEEKLEEGELLARGRGKDIIWGLADDRRASRGEVTCDVNVASAEGGNKALVEIKACARWGRVRHRDDGLDGGKSAVFAGLSKAGNVDPLSCYGFDVIRVNEEVVVG